MEETIEFDIRLERSTGQVWLLITDPDALGSWMLGDFEFEPVVGSTLVFNTEDQVKRGEITEVEVERRFAWRWSDGADSSEVSITIEGDEEHCYVQITERLLPPRRWSQPSIPPVEASIA